MRNNKNNIKLSINYLRRKFRRIRKVLTGYLKKNLIKLKNKLYIWLILMLKNWIPCLTKSN